MPRKTVRNATQAYTGSVASMRPRPDAAENRNQPRPGAGRSKCFNEAAARCRGKPAVTGISWADETWLQ